MAVAVSKKSQELAQKLWSIANDLRGSMDSSKFKNYILGVIFYRYLSERTENYVAELLIDDDVTYSEALQNKELREEVVDWMLETLGYIIEPEYLFSSMIDLINNPPKKDEDRFSVSTFEKAIKSLTDSTIGQKSEAAFDKLFDDMNLQDKDLGKEVSERTNLISKVMLKVSDISFDYSDVDFDILGTAYMQLISLFASDAGKKGGEFFTPSCVSELLAKLVTVDLQNVRSVCDCTAGSGSLMLEVQRALGNEKISMFYGQEKNGSTYNLLRMNLIMHGVDYQSFTVFNDDTLTNDHFEGMPGFHIQVANPPYSIKWSAGKLFESDPRFSACGALAPKQYADLAFLEHMVYHMAEDGRVAVLLPHGVLFRGNAEKKIREYLIGNLNCIDAIIGLPANLFHGTTIPTICMILKKQRNGDSGNICFIDASQYYKAGKKMNELTAEDIDRIVNAYKDRKNIKKFCYIAPLDEVISKNKFNCNIPRYVDTFEEEEPVDMDAVGATISDARNRKQQSLDKVNEMLAQLGLKGV